MKITIENYEDVFASLDAGLEQVNVANNESVSGVFKRIKEKINNVRKGGDTLKEDNKTLKIGVVGQVKAGKSSFLNSLIFDGENVLPRASTPMTAGLTVLKYGENNQFEVEYYNRKELGDFESKADEYDNIIQELKKENPSMTDEEIIRSGCVDDVIVSAKELLTNCSEAAKNKIEEKSKVEIQDFSGIKDLQNILEDYVGANGSFTSVVKSLTIVMNDERLKDVQVVDTPGVNDPVVSRETRTREFLRGCHGVFFLSFSGRFFDSTDVSFLTDRIGSQGIGTVVLIASKFDSALQDVGMKFEGDLGGAISHCENALKKQFRQNISTSNYNGDDPIVDFSSGIGFSIAQKEEAKWDEIEAHVVKRMKHLYPGYFTSIEDIKETFLSLSQIPDIRERYFEKTFKQNRDKIIQAKVNDYFAKSNTELSKIVKEGTNRLENECELLRGSDIQDLQAHKKALEKLLKDIKSDLYSLTSRMDDFSMRCVKDCLNDLDLRYDRKVVVDKTTADARRQGTIWGSNKSFQHIYDQVDISTTLDKVNIYLSNALNKLKDKWDKKNAEIQNKIRETISDIITQSERDDDSGLLDGKVLNNILNEVLVKISSEATLDLASVKNSFLDTVTSQVQGLDRVKTSFGAMSESEAKYKISEEAENNKRLIIERISACVSAARDDIERELQRARNNSISALKDNRERFLVEVDNKTKEFIDTLEEQLKDKENQLSIYENAISGLKALEAKI